MSGKNAIYNPSTAHAHAYAVGVGAVHRQISQAPCFKKKNHKSKLVIASSSSSKRQALREA
jgi:hypothetical protein